MAWNTDLEGPILKIAGNKHSPLRVISGPGTGKSLALKRRVARLLEEEHVDPKKILAITFTRNAAANLVKDLRSLSVQGCESVWSGTLHSYCYGLLSKQAVFDYVSRFPRPLIYFNKSGVMQFEGAPLLQDICFGGEFGTKRQGTKRIRAFEAAWARLQTDEPGWALEPLDQAFQKSVIEWLIFHNAILIGELIFLALRYLRENPLAPERTAFSHILVDEYQDLNKAEQVLIDFLCEASTLTIVGDPDQSIYSSFRYAHPSGILSFWDTHPGTYDEPLTGCKRCPSKVVTLADCLIKKNYHPKDPPRLQSLPGNPEGEVHIVQWQDIADEAQGIAEFCHYLIHRRGYRESEILIITPRRLLGYGIRDTLKEYDISAHSFYHEELLESGESQESFALLNLLCNPNDRVALRFLLGFGSPSWNTGAYSRLREYCIVTGDSPWQALEKLAKGVINIQNSNSLVRRFGIINERLNELVGLKGYALMDALFPKDALWSFTVRDIMVLHIDEHTEPSQLYDLLITHITQPEMPEEGDFTRVMSLHKSKGLTSKVVIVAGCIEGLIPTKDPDHTPEEAKANLEEQRRLFYVAITRCSEIIVLSSVVMLDKKLAYRMGAELNWRGRTITSGFINELGPTAPDPKPGPTWVQNGFI